MKFGPSRREAFVNSGLASVERGPRRLDLGDFGLVASDLVGQVLLQSRNLLKRGLGGTRLGFCEFRRAGQGRMCVGDAPQDLAGRRSGGGDELRVIGFMSAASLE